MGESFLAATAHTFTDIQYLPRFDAIRQWNYTPFLLTHPLLRFPIFFQLLQLQFYIGSFVKLEPRVGLAIEAELQSGPQRLAAVVVFENFLLHVVQADPVDVVHGALKIPTFFAVELQERAAVLQHFFGCFQLAEEVRGAFKKFGDDVRSGDFPNKEESY